MSLIKKFYDEYKRCLIPADETVIHLHDCGLKLEAELMLLQAENERLRERIALLESAPPSRTDDPKNAQVAAHATMHQNGSLRTVRKHSDRHFVLVTFLAWPRQRMIDAGERALASYGVGEKTESLSQVGRRRCTDLVKMGLITRTVDHDTTSEYELTVKGINALNHLRYNEAWHEEN